MRRSRRTQHEDGDNVDVGRDGNDDDVQVSKKLRDLHNASSCVSQGKMEVRIVPSEA